MRACVRACVHRQGPRGAVRAQRRVSERADESPADGIQKVTKAEGCMVAEHRTRKLRVCLGIVQSALLTLAQRAGGDGGVNERQPRRNHRVGRDCSELPYRPCTMHMRRS